MTSRGHQPIRKIHGEPSNHQIDDAVELVLAVAMAAIHAPFSSQLRNAWAVTSEAVRARLPASQTIERNQSRMRPRLKYYVFVTTGRGCRDVRGPASASPTDHRHTGFAQRHHHDRWKATPTAADALRRCDQGKRHGFQTLLAAYRGATQGRAKCAAHHDRRPGIRRLGHLWRSYPDTFRVDVLAEKLRREEHFATNRRTASRSTPWGMASSSWRAATRMRWTR